MFLNFGLDSFFNEVNKNDTENTGRCKQNVIQNKILLFLFYLFIVLSLVYIIFASIIGRGAFLDGTQWSLDMLVELPKNEWFFNFVPRTRNFIILIEQLPVNIAYKLGFHSKELLKFMFSLPLFLFPFLVTLWNFKLIERTKKFDIAFASLFIYGVFILSGIMYSVVEALLAVPIILLLYHYFVADINYTKKDMVIMTLLSVILFDASEIVIFTGTFMFFLSLYFFKTIKDKKQKTVKLLIGILQFTASIELMIRNIFFIDDTKNETINFFKEIFLDVGSNLIGIPLLVIITIIISLFLYFYKKKISIVSTFIIILVYFCILGYLLMCAQISLHNFVSIPLRILLYVIVPLFFLVSYIRIFFSAFIKKECLYNLFTVALMCSIANTCIQLYFDIEINNRINKFVQIINSSNKNILMQEEDLHQIYGGDNFFFSRLFPMSDYLLYTKEYKKNKIIIPQYGAKGFVKTDEGDTLLVTNQGDSAIYNIPIKTEYWDLTGALELYKNSPLYPELSGTGEKQTSKFEENKKGKRCVC